jgi:hypothetical protein
MAWKCAHKLTKSVIRSTSNGKLIKKWQSCCIKEKRKTLRGVNLYVIIKYIIITLQFCTFQNDEAIEEEVHRWQCPISFNYIRGCIIDIFIKCLHVGLM